jgi:hypothetical protein
LWNTMLKMRKLADCCNDLATYAPPLSQTHLPSPNRRHPMNFQPRAAPVRDVCSPIPHVYCSYGEAKPPAEQGIDECVPDELHDYSSALHVCDARCETLQKLCNVERRYQEGITGKAAPRRGPYYVQDPQVALRRLSVPSVRSVQPTACVFRASAAARRPSRALPTSSSARHALTHPRHTFLLTCAAGH